MKKLLSVLIILSLVGCKTIITEVNDSDDGQIVMKSSEKWTFFDPEEKLKLIFAPENGGQIQYISWEGKKFAENLSDSYPNKEKEIQKLTPRIINDGSDLVMVYSTVRGEFRLQRSFKLLYNEKTKEHFIEVIYNVKNYSGDTPIDQQWIHNLSLPKSSKLSVAKNEISGEAQNASFRISALDVSDLQIENINGQIKIANRKSFKLGFKEKLSWKVHYSLKSSD